MHPDDIHKTAVSTPRGLFEWTVMPMGFRNSPAIQQRRLESALRGYIGKICHVYLDDIIIWSNNLNEHINNVDLILSALRKAGVFINAKKSVLFTTDVEFLGHKISQAGIEACEQKAGKIIDWPIPTSSTETRQFLGLVHYLQIFLPDLATHCKVLEELTQKRYEREFPEWTQNRQNAFDAIKQLVVSRECLTVIDPDLMPEYKIFVTTDASDIASGAVLSFGKTWETARPVAYDSCSFKGAELNYPVHEKEMLAVVCALKKWKYELLGAPFFVYTDHKTLLNFHTQRDLSRCQARWMELLSIYDCKFVYVKGEANSVADALFRLPSLTCPSSNDADIVASHPYNIADPQTLLTGIKHKASTSYHPQTDGASERTNKTLIHSLRFHVERNQSGWVAALPRIRFNYMCTVNKSTGYSPFMLHFGRNPIVLPPLDPTREPITQDEIDARAVISHIYASVNDAKDNLLLAKISQAFEANKSRKINDTFPYKIGDSVLLSTLNRQSAFLSSDGKCAVKFVPRFDGPYAVVDTFPESSTVTLNLPNQPSVFPTFHINLIKPFLPNDDNKFPHCAVTIDEDKQKIWLDTRNLKTIYNKKIAPKL